jgi:hypothetical protein
MPLDSFVDFSDNDYYKRSLGAELKFVWLPKTCNLSGKTIWLTHAYRIHRLPAVWTGPDNPVLEHRWHEKKAHIMWLLKR